MVRSVSAAVWLLRQGYPDRTPMALTACAVLGGAVYIGFAVSLQRAHLQYAITLLRTA